MQPKSVTIDPTISPQLLPSVRKAQTALERVLGRSAPRVDVSWAALGPKDSDSTAVRVTLSDSDIARSYDFLDGEFREDLHVRRMLFDVWDGILAERIRISLRNAVESLVESGSE